MEAFTPQELALFIKRASKKMDENRDHLVQLDQLAGDGDLGITMKAGFAAMDALAATMNEEDCGRMLMGLGMELNEAAPSSLGTILSSLFMAGGKAVRGRQALDQEGLALFWKAGIEGIMARAHSKPGERTILDSLCPAAEALAQGQGLADALPQAAKAAAAGTEATKTMAPVHGRAAYYGDKVMGHPDGGAVVGQLIFEALASC